MRPSALATALSAVGLTRASVVPRDAGCYGEAYNGICCVNGEWAGDVISTAVSSDLSSFDSAASTFYTAHSSSLASALSGVASRASSFVSANSQSLQSDLASAQPFLSTLSNSLKSIEATATPPPDPFGKRDVVTIHESSISSILSQEAENGRNAWDKVEVTVTVPSWVTTWTPPAWTPPAHPDIVVEERDNIEARNTKPRPTHVFIEKRETITIQSASLESVVSSEANNWHHIEQTWTPPAVPTETWTPPTPPTPPDVIFNKRAVSVVSPGLTCYGQAVVTMSASDAASQIASATNAAKGTRYIANSSGGTFVVASQTSTAGAMNTRGPMLVVGGAAIAAAFAAM